METIKEAAMTGQGFPGATPIARMIAAAEQAEAKIQGAATQEERETYQRIAHARWEAVCQAEAAQA